MCNLNSISKETNNRHLTDRFTSTLTWDDCIRHGQRIISCFVELFDANAKPTFVDILVKYEEKKSLF